MQHGKTYANIKDPAEVFEIGINRAVDLIAEKESGASSSRGGFGAKRAAPQGQSLGDHPTLGGVIELRKGRFGPYVTHNGVNATLPKSIAPESVTLSQAVI